MLPFISLLTDLLIVVLTSLAVKCGLDVNAHQGDIAAVAGTLSIAICSAIGVLVIVGKRWLNRLKTSGESGGGGGGTKGGGAAAALVLMASIVMTLGMGGCSWLATGGGTQLTPRQQYGAASGTYDVVVIALAVQSKGHLPDDMVANLRTAQARLAESSAYIRDNPDTADVPGAPLPPLAPLNIALDALRAYLHNLPLAPLDVPATQPSVNQS